MSSALAIADPDVAADCYRTYRNHFVWLVLTWFEAIEYPHLAHSGSTPNFRKGAVSGPLDGFS